MSRATPLVTCSLPVVYVCLSIRLETKPRGSIDGPTSSDKNLPRRPFITETNLFRFIILILSYSIRSFLTPFTGRVFPVCLLLWAKERGTIYLTRDYLIWNILDCEEYLRERSERLETAMLLVRWHVRNGMPKILRGKYGKRRTFATNKLNCRQMKQCFQSATKTFSIQYCNNTTVSLAYLLVVHADIMVVNLQNPVWITKERFFYTLYLLPCLISL